MWSTDVLEFVNSLAAPVSAASTESTLPAIYEEPIDNGSGAGTSSVVASGNQSIDGILSGIRWLGPITYSDPDSTSDYQSSYPQPLTNLQQISATQLAAAHGILNATVLTQNAGLIGFSVEGFTNLSIEYAGAGSGTGTLRLVNTDDPSTAYAYYPSTGSWGGDSFYGPSGRNPVAGNYDYYTVVHELGHALGLKHGHETGGFGALPTDVDSMEFSVMTYRSYIGAPTDFVYNEQWGFAQTFMMLDIAALQYMYGADFTTNAGNTTYKWTPSSGDTQVNGAVAIDAGGDRIFATIWDGGGTDTYDLSAYTTSVTIDLAPGGYSVFSDTQLAYLGNSHYARGNIFNALQYNGDARSLIENAVGGSAGDTLKGNAANNTLNGLGGADKMYGYSGNDRYVVDSFSDQVFEVVGQGTDDRVYSSVSYTLAANQSIEWLATTNQSGTGTITLTGNNLAQLISGNNGANTLSGGGGGDRMYGHAGDDRYIIGSYSDKVFEVSGAGHDRVYTSRSYTLQDNQSIEWLATTNQSGTGTMTLIGNNVGQLISGNNGANVIDGKGGSDSLYGQGGADTFRFSTALSSGNVDAIRDYSAAADQMQLSQAIFTGIGGTLDAGEFRLGTAAGDANDRIIYNSATGALYFDADGSGSGAQIQFATLTTKPALTAGEFQMIA